MLHVNKKCSQLSQLQLSQIYFIIIRLILAMFLCSKLPISASRRYTSVLDHLIDEVTIATDPKIASQTLRHNQASSNCGQSAEHSQLLVTPDQAQSMRTLIGAMKSDYLGQCGKQCLRPKKEAQPISHKNATINYDFGDDDNDDGLI